MAQWCINGQLIEVGSARMSAEDWTQGKGPRGGSVWTNTKTGEKRYGKENPGGSGKSKNGDSVQKPASSSSDQRTDNEVIKKTLADTRNKLVAGYSRDTSAGKMVVKEAYGTDSAKVAMGQIGDLNYTMTRVEGNSGIAGTDISMLIVYDKTGKSLFAYNGDWGQQIGDIPSSGPGKAAVESLIGSAYHSGDNPKGASDSSSNESSVNSTLKEKPKVIETPNAKQLRAGMPVTFETIHKDNKNRIHVVKDSKGKIVAQSTSGEEMKNWIENKKLDVSYPEDDSFERSQRIPIEDAPWNKK